MWRWCAQLVRILPLGPQVHSLFAELRAIAPRRPLAAHRVRRGEQRQPDRHEVVEALLPRERQRALRGLLRPFGLLRPMQGEPERVQALDLLTAVEVGNRGAVSSLSARAYSPTFASMSPRRSRMRRRSASSSVRSNARVSRSYASSTARASCARSRGREQIGDRPRRVTRLASSGARGAIRGRALSASTVLEVARDRAVELPAARARHRPVRAVADQHVLEAVLDVAGDLALWVPDDQPAVLERVQRVDHTVGRHHGGEHVAPEGVPDHRGVEQHRPRARRERVDPRRDRREHGRRQLLGPGLVGDRGRELLEEQRVPLAGGHDALDRRRAHLGEQRRGDGHGFVRRERSSGSVVWPIMPPPHVRLVSSSSGRASARNTTRASRTCETR